VITTRDELIPSYKQRELAAAAGGPVFEAGISHMEVTTSGPVYNPVLLQALEALGARTEAKAAYQVR
jgi:hypothetical protein